MISKKPKFSWEKVPITHGDIKVLKELFKCEYGFNQQKLSESIIMSIGAVCKTLSKLNSFGLVYCISYPIKIYRLVPERKKEIEILLTEYDFGKNEELIIDAHNFVYESEVKELPEIFLKKLVKEDSWIEFIPLNWKAYKMSYLDGSVKFHKTKKGCKVFFYFRTFSKDPNIADMINTQKFLDKKRLLENKYRGLKIGKFGLVAKCSWQEVAILRDPIAVKAIKLGIKHPKIEDSHKIGGEWEEKGFDAVEKIRKILSMRDKE